MRTASKRAKAKRRAKRRAVMSRLMREKPLTMSVDDLVAITDSSRNGGYAAIANGTYPAVRQGRRIKVLVGPTMAILNGTRAPGSVADHRAAESPNSDAENPATKLNPASPRHPDSAAKKRRRAAGLVSPPPLGIGHNGGPPLDDGPPTRKPGEAKAAQAQAKARREEGRGRWARRQRIPLKTRKAGDSSFAR
jgi:hypothetical protein